MKESQLLNSIVSRAHLHAMEMIYEANHRDNIEKGDPKIGGHPAAVASSIHITAALHLKIRSGFDHIANKPHGSPCDHAYHYLLNLFFKDDFKNLTDKEKKQAMHSLRAFPKDKNSFVFQSYHSDYDPDSYHFLPSGTVGIPPVVLGYLAHAYKLAKTQSYKVPSAHFWAILGDSEFREGSVFEAVPDFAERKLGNLTWILDYNRQSLDGHRITQSHFTDATRIEKTMEANGWEVIHLIHGQKREKLFKKNHGKKFKEFLEKDVSDYEMQCLLNIAEKKELKKYISLKYKKLKNFLKNVSEEDLFEAIHDLGGHDLDLLVKALEKSKKNKLKPCLVIAHTIKGWGLNMAARSANHSLMISKEEILSLRKKQNLKTNSNFETFPKNSFEEKFLKKRELQLKKQINEQRSLKSDNLKKFKKSLDKKQLKNSLDIPLKLVSYPHTQWMLGQLTSKLNRIANTENKDLKKEDKYFKHLSEMIVSMAPDVGTSTNLNPSMDGKIYGEKTEDIEKKLKIKDKKSPNLVPQTKSSNRFIRFDITEANTMSCLGAYGKMKDILGVCFLPLMTVYDFFIKRALDQYFYNLYWKSQFILIGTPSGVSLSPEGAQHGWKSDIQIPNQITWEPSFCIELDWIFCDALKRYATDDSEQRQGVLIRAVTRGLNQKLFTDLLKTQSRFKKENKTLCHEDFPLKGAHSEADIENIEEEKILETVRKEVLQGAYFLINYENYKDYKKGENVIHIFSMGALTDQAIAASKKLLKKGIYANVIVVSSPDLLLGNLAHKNNYSYLRKTLGINAELFIQSSKLSEEQFRSLSGKRVPLVSVHDGEPGLLDNIGSIAGVKQESLSVRKHSKCGRPSDIYAYHQIDSESIIEACKKALAETTLEKVRLQPNSPIRESNFDVSSWEKLWT